MGYEVPLLVFSEPIQWQPQALLVVEAPPVPVWYPHQDCRLLSEPFL